MMQRWMKTGCKGTFLLLLVFTLSGAAMAQYGGGRGRDRFGGGPRMAQQAAQPPENLFKAMQAQGVASTITAGQLTADWGVITLGELGLLNPTVSAYFGYYNGGSLQPMLYYTNGEVLSFGGQTYLAAYTLQEFSDPDQRTAQQYYEDQFRRMTPERRTPQLLKDSVLALSLLSLNQSESFHLIQQFDPTADIVTAPSKMAIDRDISLSNLKQIGLATMMYVQDYDEKYPPMVAARSVNQISPSFRNTITAATTVQSRLLPYIKDTRFFLQPVTQRPYLPNYKLSKVPMANVKDPSHILLFYEDAPDAEGMRNVAYADGHAETITEAEFQRERIAQGISASGYPPAARPRHKAKATPKPH